VDRMEVHAQCGSGGHGPEPSRVSGASVNDSDESRLMSPLVCASALAPEPAKGGQHAAEGLTAPSGRSRAPFGDMPLPGGKDAQDDNLFASAIHAAAGQGIVKTLAGRRVRALCPAGPPLLPALAPLGQSCSSKPSPAKKPHPICSRSGERRRWLGDE